MMEQTLKHFTEGSVREASVRLLSHLHISHTQEEPSPIQYCDYYDRGEIPQYIQRALTLCREYYYIGEVCDDALTGNDTGGTNLREDLKKLRDDARYKSMMLFAVDLLPDAHITRTYLSALTRAFNRLVYNFPVTVIFRQGNLLSIGTCERTERKLENQKDQGEIVGKVCLLRNIDCQNLHRGYKDILDSIKDKKYSTFDDLYKHWLEVFSSKLLTKQFYNDLFEWYQWAVSSDSNVYFPEDVDPKAENREDKDTRIIRLITRLMFVWFIKQKDLIPSCIFDTEYIATILKNFDAQSKTDGNYYQAILQNLFFGTLNRPIIEDGERREFAKSSSKDSTNLYRYSELFSITENEVIDLFSTVPFLNCGLFECLDKTKTLDGVKVRCYRDGFSRNDLRAKDGRFKYRAVVPNVLFFDKEKGLLSLFKRYVFTIEENTPHDVQVALDPELLGKVFENLLGYYNPETHDTARNESGSFYTPREIVQYMVNESLVAHLKRTVGEELEKQYRQLLDYTSEDIQLTDSQKSQILHSLFTCKILDPACGSGAFPMGMLQQMVHILQQVDPDNTQWRDVLLNMAVEESRIAFGIVDEEERQKKLLDIEETFNNGLNSPDYTRKLYIIESCIYGVDIKPIAMLISRLRFFITLICEQTDIQRDKPELNFGIKTLPNLETKFVAANSLINADIHQYNEDWTKDEVLAILKNELLAIRRRHFYTRKRSEKIRLLREDEAKRKQIHDHINRLVGEPNEKKIEFLQQQIAEYEKLKELYQGEDWVEETVYTDLFSQSEIIRYDRNKRERDKIDDTISACKRDIERERSKCTPKGFQAAVLQVTKWNPYDQNSISQFLDVEWMFGVTDGFDIVIGNPPYRQLQDNKGELAKLYETCGYKTFNRSGDIYELFYERGNQLLKDEGALCYITSNKWMRAAYGAELREYLTSIVNPCLLIDFGETHVFESATVMTNILLFQKVEYKNPAVSIQIDEDFIDPSTLMDYVNNHQMCCQFEGRTTWVIMSDTMRKIKEKVEALGKSLKEWKIDINYGIKTGYDKAFWINQQKKEEILSWCKTESERIETSKLIRPVLRGKDIEKFSCKWAGIWLISTFPSRKYDIDNFPAIKKHLLTFSIERLEQTGNKHIINGELVKSRKKTCGKWFELQDSISYWKEFDQPKIIYPETTKFMPFVYDDQGYLANKTCFIMVGEHLFYLVAFLNSSLFKYCFRDNFGALFGGARGMSKVFFDKIPVLEVSDAIDAEFRELVLDIQKDYSEEKAKAIDQRIFDLYGLTQEERDAIGYIDFHNNNDNETDDDE